MKILFAVCVASILIFSTATAQLIPLTEDQGNCFQKEILVDSVHYARFMRLDSAAKYLWAKEGWEIIFPYDVFHAPYLTTDTVLTVDDQAADDSVARVVFDSVRATFGDFILIKLHPNRIDSEEVAGYFAIRFDSVQNLDSVTTLLKLLPNADIKYATIIGFPSYIPNDASLLPRTPHSKIDLSITSEFYPPNLHKLGWGWHHYAIKTPMAWEISKGDPSTIIGAWDIFSYSQHLTHSDFVERLSSSSTSTGNWIRNTPSTSGDGPSTATHSPGWEHGTNSLSMAIGKGNNNIASPPSGALAGTCMNCHGVAFSGENSIGYTDHSLLRLYDFDGSKNYSILSASVINFSFGGPWDDQAPQMDEIMKSGIILVSAQGNGLVYPCGGHWPWGELKTIGNIEYYYPKRHGIGTLIYTPDANNPSKDYKPISVTGTWDGNLVDNQCNLWPGNRQKPNYIGGERFDDSFNYAPGTDKFNFDKTDIKKRRDTKSNAFIDIAAPAEGLISTPSNASQVATGNKYDFIGGTSFAAPQVAGICGLMVSLNKYLGVELNGIGRPIDGPEVQRRAWNIIAFTADKLKDDGKVPDPWICSGKTQVIIPSQQPYYLQQENDNLRRSWAQRMGFGRVNAYRAVAHSIRQKGDYEYTLTGDITLTFEADDGTGDERGYMNYEGTRVMHWGSMVKEGTGLFEMPISRGPTASNNGILNVLEWGGVSLPGEYHNNQGVTLVHNATGNTTPDHVIFVPFGGVLAIDGVLMSDQPSLYHTVMTQADGSNENWSRILLEGYVKDMQVFGNLRVGDVIVTSSNGTTTGDWVADIGSTSGCIGFGHWWGGYESEVYGKVRVQDKGFIFSIGKVRTRPGSHVSLEGVHDFILEPHATLAMEHASGVTGIAGRKIIVEDEATLIIEPGAYVDLDVEVNVRDGGTLIIKDSAMAHIRYLNVERGGTLKVLPAATLALEEQEHRCDGITEIVGVTETVEEETTIRRAQVIGKLSQHCLPYGDANYMDFQYITTQPTIYISGNCTEPTQTTLKLQYAYFKDVSVTADNVAVVDDISHCNFETSTMLTNPYMSVDHLLAFTFNNCVECEVDDFKSIRFDNCTFYDRTGAQANPNDVANWNRRIYRTGGLLLTGYETAWVHECQFEKLEFGVSSFDCSDIKITSSDFTTCGIGDYSFASYPFLCNNTYEEVQYGSVRDHSLVGKAFDNEYTKTRIGYGAVSSDEQRLRGNVFFDYFRGISASCSDILLADKVGGGTTTLYGRNKFEIDPIVSLSTYPNKFITKSCETSKITDINIRKTCCTITMACGYNKMSLNAASHLRYDGPGTFPTIIDITYNWFMSLPLPAMPVPRLSNVTVQYLGNNTANIQQYEDDENCCGDRVVASEIACPNTVAGATITCTNESYTAPHGLIAPQGNTNSFGNFSGMLAYYNSIKGKANSKSQLRDLRATVESAENLVPEDRILFLRFLDAKINPNPKTEIYRTVLAGRTAQTGKRTGEEVLNGMALLGTVRSLLDEECFATTSVENDLQLDDFDIAVVPNPFSGEATLYYTIPQSAYTRVVVRDIYGRTVATLFSGLQQQGSFTLTIQHGTLNNGTYFCSVETESGSRTAKIVNIK
jgi:hypothetical protein